MLKKNLLQRAVILICLSWTLCFGSTGTNTASDFNTSVPNLVGSADKSRLLSTLTLLTASPRKSHEVQESVLTWIKATLDTTGASTRFHSYQYSGQTWHNLVATIPQGASADPAEEHLVIGAHIDSVSDSPGADDNAGGVAAVMEAVRVLALVPLGMRVDFIFFTNEEAGKIGSLFYAREARASGETIKAMIAVDMVAFGPADEDLDLVTTPETAWLAHIFKEAGDLYTTLPTKVVIKEKCG